MRNTIMFGYLCSRVTYGTGHQFVTPYSCVLYYEDTLPIRLDNRFVYSWHTSNYNKLDSKSSGIKGLIVTNTS